MKHQARKRFGQNFLTDDRVIDQIVSAINPQPTDVIIEIGPGQAALTRSLLASGAAMHLLEIDRDLAQSLARQLEGYDRATLHVGDALTMDFGDIAGGKAFRLVGNLPYNISTPVMFHALEWADQIIDMHFMLQREVVERMASGPGSKAWGRLSIMCQYYCQVTPLFDVPPEAFSPRPRVQSSVVKLVPHAKPPVDLISRKAFDLVVRQAFGQRRKTLRNSLGKLLDSSQIADAGVDPGLRAEALSMNDFAKLSRLID